MAVGDKLAAACWFCGTAHGIIGNSVSIALYANLQYKDVPTDRKDRWKVTVEGVSYECDILERRWSWKARTISLPRCNGCKRLHNIEFVGRCCLGLTLLFGTVAYFLWQISIEDTDWYICIGLAIWAILLSVFVPYVGARCLYAWSRFRAIQPLRLALTAPDVIESKEIGCALYPPPVHVG